MSPWQCSGDHAALSLSAFDTELDLARPWLGLHNIRFDGTSQPGMRLLGIHSDPGVDTESIADQYLRDEDLVVNYSQTEQRPASLHTYWRAFVGTPHDDNIVAPHGDNIVGVDLIVSRQTDRIDCDPSLRIVNEMPVGEMIRDDADAPQVLHRPMGCDISVLLAVHPADCEAMDTSSHKSETNEVAFRLFHPGLEKGVIRRARLRAAILPRKNDERLAAELLASFLTEELPLTT